MKNKKPKSSKLDARKLRSEIARFFLKNPGKEYNARQILKKIRVENTKTAVQDALSKLEQEGLIRISGAEKYRLRSESMPSLSAPKKVFEGYLDMTRTGAGYVICEELKEDVYVPAKFLNGALNKDRVKIELFHITNRRRPEAQVVEVLSRASSQFIGTLKYHGKRYYVYPDGMYHDFFIYVEHDALQNAEPGDKVIVRITEWPGKKRVNAAGEIIDVLGKSGSSDIEMKTILINQGFELEFPKEVMKELAEISSSIREHDIINRRDMRDILTFTIDPEDAKDFDDAISYRELENGNIEVGVHIADVAHYVHPGSALDKDAFKRSTSVYLVDRVLPMLPEKLSNELCSLRPNEDKLTFSAVFIFDKDLHIQDKWFGRTVIHSDMRFSYEQAQEVLDNKEGPYADVLQKLNELAGSMRKVRFAQGAIAFESEEIRFRLDEDGKPLEIFVKERKDTHLLIEDFMLLANKEVAQYIAKKGEGREIPFVYRVHDLPNMEKLNDFKLFAAELGFKRMDLSGPKQIANSFNELSKEARTNEALRLLEPLAIRTMAKAEYSPDNIGHYGLGFEYYTHFTSPIRRYSDVLVHRILFDNLSQETRYKKEELEFQCRHISIQERKAMDAERESVKYKQVEFIERYIGNVFDGRISGMIDRGIFVEIIENKCEGLITFDHMMEPFHIEESRLKARGLASGRILKMGDTVQVRVLDTNLEKRQIELELVDF